jgi:hypothetical protein
VNRPSVEALRPDHCGGIHATRDLVGQSEKGSVGRGGACNRNCRRRTRGTPKNTTSLEQRGRRVTFVLEFRRAGSRRLNLKASWSSSGVASGKSVGSH